MSKLQEAGTAGRWSKPQSLAQVCHGACAGVNLHTRNQITLGISHSSAPDANIETMQGRRSCTHTGLRVVLAKCCKHESKAPGAFRMQGTTNTLFSLTSVKILKLSFGWIFVPDWQSDGPDPGPIEGLIEGRVAAPRSADYHRETFDFI